MYIYIDSSAEIHIDTWSYDVQVAVQLLHVLNDRQYAGLSRVGHLQRSAVALRSSVFFAHTTVTQS